MKTNYPNKPKDRFEVYRFFNGLSVEGKDGLDRQQTRLPLVKSFLFEHVSSRNGRTPRSPKEIFGSLGVKCEFLDETFTELRDLDQVGPSGKERLRTVGYVEQYSERFFAYYTCDESQNSGKRAAGWITRSPDLDFTWFSGPLLQRLWDTDVSQRDDNRFSKLSFMHESVFEMPEDASHESLDADEDESAESISDTPDDDNDSPEFERRKARFQMADRIGRIKESLGSLQQTYKPLHALYALRFPSRSGKGCHDLYQQGRITNRSSSFEEHRNLVRYLYRTYDSVLMRTEETAWHSAEILPSGMRANIGTKGVPLIVRFQEELTEATFRRWVTLAFRKRNAFRLWGEPIWLGPKKVHVYGADRHLWQPINLELTEKGLTAILPQGTCGNTFHRLVTNIQTYVCPAIDAWLGADEFRSIVDNSIESSGGYIDEG